MFSTNNQQRLQAQIGRKVLTFRRARDRVIPIIASFCAFIVPNDKKNASSTKETGSQWTPKALRGAADLLPDDSGAFDFFLNRVATFARQFGFSRIEPSLLEEARLFTKGMGGRLAEQHVYSWSQGFGPLVALRPEYTVSVIRSYLTHNLDSIQSSWKLYYHGPVFLKDQSSSNYTQQFHQYGYEVLGDWHPVVDAQLISLAYNLYAELGVPVSLLVNCVGDNECKVKYTNHLQEYLRSKRTSLCEACRQAIAANPYRVFSCSEVGCVEVAETAQPVVDWLCGSCREHFVKVLEFLDELEVPYLLTPKLFKPHEYYSKTVFEIDHQSETGAVTQLVSGGRYDNLIESFGGKPTSAVGFAGFVERGVWMIKKYGIPISTCERPMVFLAQLGNESRKICLRIFEELRRAGISVVDRFSMDGLSGQLEVATKLNVRFTVILGQKELLDKTVIIRDMESGVQEVADLAKVALEVKKRIDRSVEQVYRATDLVDHHPAAGGLRISGQDGSLDDQRIQRCLSNRA